MVYYVSCNWEGNACTNGSTYGLWNNYILCFPNRSTADLFFRTLQNLQTFRTPTGGNVEITTLSRTAPQFWTWETDDTHGGNHMRRLVESLSTVTEDGSENGRLLLPLRNKVRIVGQRQYQIPDSPLVFPDQTTNGVDWISSNTFFVRQVGYNHRYWSTDGSNIFVSTTHRSKFRVCIKDSADEDIADEDNAKKDSADIDDAHKDDADGDNTNDDSHPARVMIDTDNITIYCLDRGKELPLALQHVPGHRYHNSLINTWQGRKTDNPYVLLRAQELLFEAFKRNFALRNSKGVLYVKYTDDDDNEVFECC